MNKVKAGELVIDPPTLINLGFEWVIQGDDNRNAKVEVSYRKKGDTAWKTAMPLMRLQHERVYQGEGVFNVKMPNMFAGSILDLEENTAYEVRLVLSDPDGGSAGHASSRSRPAPNPMPATGGHVYHVYPRDWKGPKEPGSFNDLMCAYNYYCGGGDTVTGGRPRVKAGDIILVHAGTYRYHPEFYTGDRSINSTTPVEGTYYLFGSGTPEKPIVIKAAGDGEVIFDGGGNFNLFNVKAANYNYFEGITFRNTEIAIWAGTQFIRLHRPDGEALPLREHQSGHLHQLGRIVATSHRSTTPSSAATIPTICKAGTASPGSSFAGVDGQEISAHAGFLYRGARLWQGHVMAYNYVANFHDGIDVETYGNPDGNTPDPTAATGPSIRRARTGTCARSRSTIYNNYMTNFHDNAFEIDGSMHNIRVMRNMMLNSASHPYVQPAGDRRADLLDPQHHL